jgi:bacterioferritin-associated ferredoxin
MFSPTAMEPWLEMIVCSCNVISDRDVRTCIKPCGASAERARDVFRCLGVSPKCGRCVRNIQALFEPSTPVGGPAAPPKETSRLRLVQAAE